MDFVLDTSVLKASKHFFEDLCMSCTSLQSNGRLRSCSHQQGFSIRLDVHSKSMSEALENDCWNICTRRRIPEARHNHHKQLHWTAAGCQLHVALWGHHWSIIGPRMPPLFTP